MTERLRRPALAPAPIRCAVARTDHPGELLVRHYRQVWTTRMHDLPFVNPALSVEAIGLQRHDGDWLGVLLTPWFLNLFLLYGGGSLWADAAPGARRSVALPCGTLQFIADDDPDLGSYQYCPLVAPVTNLPDMPTARQVAADALATVLTVPAPPPGAVPVALADAPVALADASRRNFFRRMVPRP
ncbi:MAG: [NiFe]-hydrogenase assembly chaperone HybE [Rhodoferax sp.]